MTCRRVLRIFVLWQAIAFVALVQSGHAQRPDSMRVDSAHITTDSIRNVAFTSTSSATFSTPKRQRTLEAVVTGGAGFYGQSTVTPLQVTANLDFYAQTSILDLTAGAHVGFSDPMTKSISIGLRFPVIEQEANGWGIFADASLLFFDKGTDTEGIRTGLRGALAGHYEPANFEYRIAAEVRRLPFAGDHFEAWGGIELGFFVNLLREEVSEPTRKDSLRTELKYIATSDELEQLDQVTTNDQIDAWFDRFWRARNVTGSARNEAKEEYMRRVQIANERYGSSRRMGVTTDMGRVVLIYGEPDRVESSPSQLDLTRRYILWIYNDRVKNYKTAMFLFLTEGRSTAGIFASHGESRQVYSNLPGEASEGIPNDLPAPMLNYIESFGR